MSDQRRIRVLMPDTAGRSLLLDNSGELPAFEVQLIDGETTMVAVQREVMAALGLNGPIIDCLIDLEFAEDDSRTGPIPALVELAPATDDWHAPVDLRWEAIADADPVIEPGLRTHFQNRLLEYQGLRAIPDVRAQWSQLGWYEQACAWIEQTLADRELAAPTAIEQVRHWGISAVMRVESAGGRRWFKATFPHFRNEAAVTAFLDREMSGSVAGVLGFEAAQGWLLLEDLGAETLDQNPAPNGRAIEHLVKVQRSSIQRIDQLVAVGCSRRSLNDVPGELANVLADPVIAQLLNVDGERASQLGDWLVNAVARVNLLGMSDTLVHGDFHPGNVAISDGRPVVFDWSDAAISHPLVDVVTWGTWLDDGAEGTDALWAMFFEAWAEIVPVSQLQALRPTIQAVAGAYHTISYAGILAGLEPCRRPENAGGLAEFFELLDMAVPT